MANKNILVGSDGRIYCLVKEHQACSKCAILKHPYTNNSTCYLTVVKLFNKTISCNGIIFLDITNGV